jgi:hypothetical protein
MKTNISFLVLFSILLSFNCGNSSASADARDSSTQKDSFLRAKINGKAWAATEMDPDKYVSEIMQIVGTNGTTALWIQMKEPTAIKTEDLIQTDLNHYVDEQYNMYMIKSGKITVTKINDQWVEGNFSFIATDDRSKKSITVTEGAYRVPNPKRFKK